MISLKKGPEVRGSGTLVVWVGDRDPAVAGPGLVRSGWDSGRQQRRNSGRHGVTRAGHGPFVVSVCVAQLSASAWKESVWLQL